MHHLKEGPRTNVRGACIPIPLGIGDRVIGQCSNMAMSSNWAYVMPLRFRGGILL